MTWTIIGLGLLGRAGHGRSIRGNRDGLLVRETALVRRPVGETVGVRRPVGETAGVLCQVGGTSAAHSSAGRPGGHSWPPAGARAANVPVETFCEPSALLIARHLETVVRVLVLASGPPLGRSFLGGAPSFQGSRHALFLRRVPQAAAREPLHDGVRMTDLQLAERRQQLLLRVGAKRSGFSLEDDGPVRMAWRHAGQEGGIFGACDRTGSRRFNFSMRVVRLRFRSFAACRLLPRVRSSERLISDSSTDSM